VPGRRADRGPDALAALGPVPGGQSPPDLPQRISARLGQQLAVEPADLEPQEVHPLVQVGDPRLVLVESQAAGRQPSGKPRLDLLGLLPGAA
jgi:hypothetical protein